MTCSYRERNVPKVIVRKIFRNIPRFYCNIKEDFILGDLIYCPPVRGEKTLTNRPTKLHEGVFPHI
jgi:hypothetical protein